MELQNLSFDPSKEIHIKVTRVTEYEKGINYLLSTKANLKINII